MTKLTQITFASAAFLLMNVSIAAAQEAAEHANELDPYVDVPVILKLLIAAVLALIGFAVVLQRHRWISGASVNEEEMHKVIKADDLNNDIGAAANKKISARDIIFLILIALTVYIAASVEIEYVAGASLMGAVVYLFFEGRLKLRHKLGQYQYSKSISLLELQNYIDNHEMYVNKYWPKWLKFFGNVAVNSFLIVLALGVISGFYIGSDDSNIVIGLHLLAASAVSLIWFYLLCQERISRNADVYIPLLANNARAAVLLIEENMPEYESEIDCKIYKSEQHYRIGEFSIDIKPNDDIPNLTESRIIIDVTTVRNAKQTVFYPLLSYRLILKDVGGLYDEFLHNFVKNTNDAKESCFKLSIKKEDNSWILEANKRQKFFTIRPNATDQEDTEMLLDVVDSIFSAIGRGNSVNQAPTE